MSIQYLAWDSDFFNLKVGKTTPAGEQALEEYLMAARSQNYDLIYVFIPEVELELSEGILNLYKGKKVDTKIIFYWKSALDKEKLKDFVSDYIEDFKKPYLTDELKSLALQSGLYSRFKLDINFGEDKFRELYYLWIQNSVNRRFADHVFVKKNKDKIIGFVTFKADNNKEGQIGLIAVDHSSRGKRIGQSLLDMVKKSTVDKDLRGVSVATQKDNQMACSFYLKNGFKIKSQVSIYHFWLNKINK